MCRKTVSTDIMTIAKGATRKYLRTAPAVPHWPSPLCGARAIGSYTAISPVIFKLLDGNVESDVGSSVCRQPAPSYSAR